MLDRLENQPEWAKFRCHFVRKNGSNFLFALGVEYPNFYKIPMVYLERAKEELKRLGFKVFNPTREYERRIKGLDPSPRTYRIFYLGPRYPVRPGWCRPCTTKRRDATSFRIYFYSTYTEE